MRVLLVDDAKMMHTVVRKMLRTTACELQGARNGVEGLARVVSFEPDVVVLDVSMPVMGGCEMLRRMRAAGHSTPVLLATAESGDALDAMVDSGLATAVITKPYRAPQLLGAISRATGVELDIGGQQSA